MKNQLQEIENLISNYTAMQYAKMMVENTSSEVTVYSMEGVKTETVSYKEYMQTMWGQGNDPMGKLIERATNSYLNRYAEAVKMYTGFIDNGKVFVLNKREKTVSFLYTVTKDGIAKCYVHYNPLNVDCIEFSVSQRHLFEELKKDQYDFSKNEEAIINECNILIAEERG